MCARIIVFCFGRSTRKMMNARYVVNQDGNIQMEESRSLRRYCGISH
uniref:Uncharacterized protein n=1 Tax=Arundo donax TaxID=35708 RepID=A0A0A9FBJ4_ARUDO